MGALMSKRPLSILLAVLCFAAIALPAQESGARPGAGQPSGVILGNHGTIERGYGPAGQGRWRGSPISVSLRDAPVTEVLRTFAKLAGFNLLIDPRVQGTVTCELENVPWDQAMYVILETQGLAAEVDGRVWMIAPY
jgi:type II secretory pathway component HofQ